MTDYMSNHKSAFVLGAGDNFYQNGVSDLDSDRWNYTYESLFQTQKSQNIYFFQTLGIFFFFNH